MVEKIEVVLEGVDRTQQAFATFRKNLESSVSELRKARADIFAYSASLKNAIQWQQMSAKEYVKVTSQLRQYDKYVTRLTTEIPKNQQEQARWVKSIKEGLSPIRQYITNYEDIAPLLDKVAGRALKYNNTLIETTGFTKKGSQYVETLSSKFRRLARSFSEAQGPLYKWGRVFNHYLPIIFVGVYAFRNLEQKLEQITKAFADFESQLVVIERTTGMAHDTIERLGKIFLTLGEQLPVPLSGLEDIAITAGRLGIRGEANILAFTDAIVKMSNATVLSADSASNALARIANAMGIPIPYVENLGSSIDILANTSAANAEQITTVMRKAAGAAKTMEIPASALAAMGATLVESGEEAARAGTRISRALVYASTKTAVMARQMGLSVKELRKRMEEDMLGVLLDYLKMLKDTPSKVERLSKAHEVFGMIGTKAIVKLANNYDSLVKHIKDAQDDMVYNITLEKEYAKTLDTTAAKMQMLDNAIERQKIILGEKLAPVYFKMKELILGFYKALAGPEPVEYGNMILSLGENLERLLVPSKSLLAISDKQTSLFEKSLEDMPHLIGYEDAYAKLLGATSEYQFIGYTRAKLRYDQILKEREATDKSNKSLKDHIKSLMEDAAFTGSSAIQHAYLNKVFQDSIHFISRYETGIDSLNKAKALLLDLTLKGLGVQEVWNKAEMQEIKNIEKEVKAHHGSAVEFLARTDAIRDGAFSQMVLNDVMNRGMRVLAKYSPHMKRAVSLASSLTKVLVEEGLASDKLKDVWEELGELLEQRMRLSTELSQIELQWNAITEDKSNLESQLSEIFEDQLSVIGRLLESSKNLAESYFILNDALQYLNGEYPTFESLTRGILATINGTIVPIKALDLGIIRLSNILPSKYFNVLDILLEKHKQIVESYEELNAAELEYGPGSEEVIKARAKVRASIEEYSKSLSDFTPILVELNKKEREWGLTESKRYKQIKDAAVLNKEELEVYKDSIDAASQYYSNLDRIFEIRQEILSLSGLQVKAEELWQEVSKGSRNKMEAFIKVLDKLGIAEDKERKKAIERIKEVINSKTPLEDQNRIIIDYIAGLMTISDKEGELKSIEARINQLRTENNRLLYENLRVLADTGYISGKVADDLQLFISAAQDVGKVTAEDKEKLKDMIMGFIYVGESTGTIEEQMSHLGDILRGFGFSFEFIPDKAKTAMDETKLIIKDAMGGMVFESTKEFQNIRDMISGLPEETKENLKRGVEEWGTLFERAKILNIAFSAPMEEVFRNQLIELHYIKENTKLIAQKGIPVRSMHTGGKVEYTGLHLLHKGEIVVPEKIARQLNVSRPSIRESAVLPTIKNNIEFGGISVPLGDLKKLLHSLIDRPEVHFENIKKVSDKEIFRDIREKEIGHQYITEVRQNSNVIRNSSVMTSLLPMHVSSLSPVLSLHPPNVILKPINTSVHVNTKIPKERIIKTHLVNMHETYIDGVHHNEIERSNTNITERTFSTISSYLRSNEIYENNRETFKEINHVLDSKVIRENNVIENLRTVKESILKNKEVIRSTILGVQDHSLISRYSNIEKEKVSSKINNIIEKDIISTLRESTLVFNKEAVKEDHYKEKITSFRDNVFKNIETLRYYNETIGRPLKIKDSIPTVRHFDIQKEIVNSKINNLIEKSKISTLKENTVTFNNEKIIKDHFYKKLNVIKDVHSKSKELIKYNNIINNIKEQSIVPQTGLFRVEKGDIVIPEPKVNNLIENSLNLEALNSLLASLKRLQGSSSNTNSTLREILKKGVLGSLQTGGSVGETGLYLLHEGEYVMPKSAPTQVMNIHIEHISLSPEYTAEKFLKDLEAYRFSPL